MSKTKTHQPKTRFVTRMRTKLARSCLICSSIKSVVLISIKNKKLPICTKCMLKGPQWVAVKLLRK